MHYRSLPRLFLLFVLPLVLVLAFASCSKNEPPSDLLQLFLEDATKRETKVLFLTSVKSEWIQNGENAFEGKAAIELELRESLYVTATLDEALASTKETSSELPLLRHALSEVKQFPEPLRGSLLEQAPKTPLDEREYIKVATAAGQVFPAVLRVQARKGLDGWKFEITDRELSSRPPEGSPRSRFSSNSLVVGANETRVAIQSGIAQNRKFAQTVTAAKADVTKAQNESAERERRARAEALELKQKAIKTILVPGAVLWGTIEEEGKSPRRVGLVVGRPAGSETAYPVDILLADDFPRVPQGLLQVRSDPAARYAVSLTSSSLAADLDPQDGRLVGPVAGGSGRAFFSPISIERLQAEKDEAAKRVAEVKAVEEKAAEEKKAAEKKAAEEKKQQEAAYAAALAAALTPGSGFQGPWKARNNQTGSIGIAITGFSADGVNATGFLFDPMDRAKRKPFAAIINKAFKSDSALLVQSTPGSGLEDREIATDFQRDWLRKNARDTLTLGLSDDGGWVGKSQEETDISLQPIAGFAEQMKKDQEKENARRARIEQSVAAGAVWLGTFRLGNSSGEVGLVFEQSASGTVAGRVFDPTAPAFSKEFTGTYNLAPNIVPQISLAMNLHSGPEDDDTLTEFQKRWLRKRGQYEIFLSVDDEGLTGRTNSDAALRLSPGPSYKDLVAKAKVEEKARAEKILAAIQPGTRYEGVWKQQHRGGEIAVVFKSLRAVSVSAEFFDPADPDLRWLYQGSVDVTPGAKWNVNLSPTGEREGEFRRDSTWDLLNYHRGHDEKIQLLLTDDGLAGIWGVHIGGRADMDLKRISPEAKAVETATPAEATVNTSPAEGAAVKYPALSLAANGKPRAAVHRVAVEGKTVRLDMQVLAPGKTAEAVRIDNVGGVSSVWRSDGKGGTPLTVTRGEEMLSRGADVMQVAMGEGETLLTLLFEDNGAVSGGTTDLRVTVFFTDKERAMCLLPAK